MLIRVSDSHLRSISKAISWRIVGTIDTFVITLVITGNFVIAGSIAGVESISKVILYYLHGYSLAEAAEIAACNVGTMKSRVHYALKALRSRLPEEQRAPAGARVSISEL